MEYIPERYSHLTYFYFTSSRKQNSNASTTLFLIYQYKKRWGKNKEDRSKLMNFKDQIKYTVYISMNNLSSVALAKKAELKNCKMKYIQTD